MNEVSRLNLGGRAALSVPLIALLIGAVTALISVAFEPDDALIKGGDLAFITFFYATILALPFGIVLSFPAVLFGHLLPKPRFGWLIGIGVVTAGVPAFLMSGGTIGEAISMAVIFGMIGAFAAVLWWLCVERFREEPVYD